MTATLTRPSFYADQFAFLWADLHPGEAVPAVSTSLARELVQSGMRCANNGACARCGVYGPLWMTVDRVLSGDRPVLGHVMACERCSFDLDEAAARLRRKRGKRSGNYIGAGA